MGGLHYLVLLLCLSLAVEASILLPDSGDYDYPSVVETTGSNNQMCAPCECAPWVPNPKASVHLEKQLMGIRDVLDSNTALLRAISTHVGFVQHELESPRDTGCPDDFLLDRETNTCLQYHVDREVAQLSWRLAQLYCQHLGPKTHLATIDTPDKLELVREHLRQADLPDAAHWWDRQVWIGGLQAKDEGHWYWTATGEALTAGQAVWGPREPNNYDNDEDCMTLGAKTLESGTTLDWLMNDQRCGSEQLYICERHL